MTEQSVMPVGLEREGSEPRGARARATDWLRLALLGGAFGCAIVAYRNHFIGSLVWWRWIVDLLAGCALFTLAVHRGSLPPEAAVRRWARRACGVLSIGATAVAIQLQAQLGRELATGVAIVIGLGAFFVARWLPFVPADVQALVGDATVPAARHPRFTLVRTAAIIASLLTGVTAAQINLAHHLAGFLLWLASLALFAAALWQRGAPADDVAAQRWRNEGGPQLSRRSEAVALLLVLMLGLAFRVMLLKDVPTIIDEDEGRQGRHAESMWRYGFPDAFDIGWNVFPNLSYMVEYGWVQALGTSNRNLRLSAATVGTLSLIPTFLWARRWWGNVIGLLAALLLACNWEHVNWSRIALNNIQQVLVAALMLASFARVLRTERWVDWVWFGYATGLAFHTYHAAKLFPALIAAASLVLMLGIRGFARRYISGALVGALAFVLCIGPLGVTTYRKWQQFYASTSNRSDLVRLTDSYHRGDVQAVRNYLQGHVLGCLFSFLSIPSPRAATFDPFVAVPFLLGVGWMAWRWRDPRHLVMLVWTAGILVIAGMMTDSAPAKTRMLGYLPVVVVMAAVVAGRVRETFFRCSSAAGYLVATPLLAAWLGAVAYRNWDTEFVFWPTFLQGKNLMREICRVIDDTPTPATFYMALGGHMVELKNAVVDCMIAPNPDRVLVNLSDDPAIVPVPPTNRGTAVLLVTSYQQELLPLIRHYYPQAHYSLVDDPHDKFSILHLFTLTAEEIQRYRGLRVTYQMQGRTWSVDAGTVAFAPPADNPQFPVQATWQGQVWIEEPGTYAFRSAGGTVRIDESAAADEVTRSLAAGWHPLELHATFSNGREQVTLEWRVPNATSWKAIPQASLHTHAEGHGLLGRYFAAAITSAALNPIATPPAYTRIDSVLSFDWTQEKDEPPPPPFAARPSTMEWQGTVDVPEGETQTLRLETTNPTQVFINGISVLTAAGAREGERVEAEVSGLKGSVPILVRTVRPADDDPRYWKLRLLWRDAGGGWTAFVPYHPRRPTPTRDDSRTIR